MKTKYKIVLVVIIISTAIFGAYQSIMYQCSALPVFMETPLQPDLGRCLVIWENMEN